MPRTAAPQTNGEEHPRQSRTRRPNMTLLRAESRRHPRSQRDSRLGRVAQARVGGWLAAHFHQERKPALCLKQTAFAPRQQTAPAARFPEAPERGGAAREAVGAE